MTPKLSAANSASTPATATSTSETAPPASAPGLASSASITTAFSVGWLLAELGRTVEPGTAERLAHDSLRSASLQGSSGSLLAAVAPAGVRVRQIQAELYFLKTDFDQAGVPEEDTEALDAKVERLAAEVDGASGGTSRNSRIGVAPLVGNVTRDALANLTAASTRLGRAFGLGYDLANTCALPHGATGDDLARLFGTRVVDIQEALADLASSLPKHAGRSVSLSLAQWQHWATDPRLSKNRLKWPQEGVEDALARQGQVWRAVLSGEKNGKDMLAMDDYLGALRSLVLPFFRRPWVWLALVGAFILIGGGIYLLVAQKSAADKVVGAAVSAAGAVGLTTASLKRDFADAAKEVEAQMWEAELDYAIAEAVTVPPGDWRITLKKIELPPPRGLDPHVAANARVVHRIARTINRHRSKLIQRWHVQKHLHEGGTYETLDGTISAGPGPGVRQRLRIAKKLIKRGSLSYDPEKVAAGAPGGSSRDIGLQGAGPSLRSCGPFTAAASTTSRSTTTTTSRGRRRAYPARPRR